MALLTKKDIITLQPELKKQVKERKCLICCKKLRGELEAHSLEKGDLADVRAELKEDAQRGIYKMIYMSIDLLRDPDILKKYNCETNSFNIVERLFPKENEVFAVADIIRELNGLNVLKPDEIFRKEIEDTKN
ncbi:hypothetical protein FC959_16715 [Clostridium botulinum]|nr:hypothetical protein [Clostridium botulinum]